MSDLLAYADAATSPELRDVFLARLYSALHHERTTRLLRERAERLARLRGPAMWRKAVPA